MTDKMPQYDCERRMPRKTAVCEHGHETSYWGDEDVDRCMQQGCLGRIVETRAAATGQ
jgi:hypothetical protein